MTDVAVECTAVPDGVEQKAGQSKALRLSVLLTPLLAAYKNDPYQARASASPAIDLARWPQAITALLSGKGVVRVHLRYEGQKDWQTYDAKISRHDGKFREQSGLAQRTWERAFPEGKDALDALRTVLCEESKARAARAAPNAKAENAWLRTYSHCDMALSPKWCTAPDTLVLGQFLHTMHLRELAQTFRAERGNKGNAIRAARESSFALARVLQEMRGLAVDAEERGKILNKAAEETATTLTRYYAATELLGTGRAHEMATEDKKSDSRLQLGLSNLDSLLEDDWLETTAIQICAPAVLHECATAYERRVPPKVASDKAIDTARRRYTGLRTQPTLAKLVRLLVDVEVPVDMKAEPFDSIEPINAFGDVAVEIVADPAQPSAKPEQLSVTRFRLHGTLGSAASPLLFGPASRYECPGGGARDSFLPLIDGFLHMRDEPGRFYLRTFHVALGLNASAAAAGEQEVARGHGAESVGNRMAPLRSQGFELGDAKGGVVIASDMLKAVSQFDRPDRHEPIYAEDLLMGFRVDIQRTAAGTTQPGPWHTATARSLTFQGIPIDHGHAHLFPAYAERDDGFVAPMARHVKEEQGVWTFPRQEIFSWSGESLALPAARDLPPGCENRATSAPPNGSGLPIACLVPQEDLNIGVSYDFAPKPRHQIPALRLGDQYRFVLRACYGNGGGPEFEPNCMKHLYIASALGATGLEAATPTAVSLDEKPATFTTPDPVTAPSLALFSNDPLVLAFNAEADRPAEKYDQLVLRAEFRPDRCARRILLPPRIAFDQAEIQKQFDHLDQPRGALIEMRLDAQQGALPQAVGGKTTISGTPGAHRGAVYELVKQSCRPHPFFCDARGRCVVLALQRPGTTPETGNEDISPPLDDLRFWELKEVPDDALPIVVEFRIAPMGVSGARFVGRPEVRRYPSSGPTRARRVVVEVGLAEKIELRTWCVDENLLSNNLFMADLNKLTTLAMNDKGDPKRKSVKIAEEFISIQRASELKSSDGKDFVQGLLQVYGGRAPSTFSDALTWSVVAATRRPLLAPRFVFENGQPPLTVRRLRTVNAEERWAASPRPVDDEPEGSQVFLDGNVEVHRRSAGELRVELLWKDFNDQVAVERIRDQWAFNPRWHRAEKSISVALSEENANQPVALDVEAATQAKRLAFEIGWQAVRIGVRLVSRTRFAHCYKPDESASANDLSPFEAESHPINAFLPPDGKVQGELAIWLKATRRPAKPEVATVELVRHFREIARSETAIVAEARWTLRLRLPKGSWHQSGEGELLAVVLLPECAVTSSRNAKPAPHHRLDDHELKLSDWLRRLNLQLGLGPPKKNEAKLTKLMQLVSGWAADPATDAGRLQPILSPGQFAGWVEKRADLTLPFSIPQDGAQNGEEFAKVAIIAYEPEIDVYTGDRYVDVDFLSPDIDSPFVRLSVARYQPHALDGLWLSSQVCLDPAVVPSRRQVELRWQGPGVLLVKVTGPAYKRRTLGVVEGPASDAEKQLLASEAYKSDVPWMQISIQRLDREGSGILAADAASNCLQRKVAPLAVSEQGLWETEFALPAAETRWRVFIEEVEFYLPGVGANQREKLEPLPRGFKCELDVDAPTPPNPGARVPIAHPNPPQPRPK